MTLDVYRGRKTTIQQLQHVPTCSWWHICTHLYTMAHMHPLIHDGTYVPTYSCWHTCTHLYMMAHMYPLIPDSTHVPTYTQWHTCTHLYPTLCALGVSSGGGIKKADCIPKRLHCLYFVLHLFEIWSLKYICCVKATKHWYIMCYMKSDHVFCIKHGLFSLWNVALNEESENWN